LKSWSKIGWWKSRRETGDKIGRSKTWPEMRSFGQRHGRRSLCWSHGRILFSQNLTGDWSVKQEHGRRWDRSF
jgi:hypothetical protein